tara:strand:- start:642 stop:1757 length:1116 start_codon:yes stop_codon:yes gene_type:complete
MKKNFLKNFKRIVVKIGSSLLISNDKFNNEWFKSFVDDIIFLRNKKIEVLIVVSGAVSLGKNYLKINKKKLKIFEKQACAACGQVILMNNFKKVFEKKKIKVAQILVTYFDIENRKNSLNSRETIIELLKCDTVPVINENDTVSIDELKFGDNDRLAARVSQIIGADNLILLSDVDGLFTNNPKNNKGVELVKEVKEVNEKIFKMATGETNFHGTGGMLTKLQAADIAAASGCNTIICRGTIRNPIKNYLNNGFGTTFLSNNKYGTSFKKWVAGAINVMGTLILDDGATEALKRGASILPSGIENITGKFFKGDIICFKNLNGKNIGKGVTYYDSKEIRIIKGRKSSEIKKLLGYDGRDEIVHRDYLILNE